MEHLMALPLFRRILASLRIVDYGLFGGGGAAADDAAGEDEHMEVAIHEEMLAKAEARGDLMDEAEEQELLRRVKERCKKPSP